MKLLLFVLILNPLNAMATYDGYSPPELGPGEVIVDKDQMAIANSVCPNKGFDRVQRRFVANLHKTAFVHGQFVDVADGKLEFAAQRCIGQQVEAALLRAKSHAQSSACDILPGQVLRLKSPEGLELELDVDQNYLIRNKIEYRVPIEEEEEPAGKMIIRIRAYPANSSTAIVIRHDLYKTKADLKALQSNLKNSCRTRLDGDNNAEPTEAFESSSDSAL